MTHTNRVRPPRRSRRVGTPASDTHAISAKAPFTVLVYVRAIGRGAKRVAAVHVGAMQRYAHSQGWSVEEVFVDAPTSSEPDQPAFHAALRRCRQAPHVDALIVGNFECSVRSLPALVLLVKVLAQDGIKLIGFEE